MKAISNHCHGCGGICELQRCKLFSGDLPSADLVSFVPRPSTITLPHRSLACTILIFLTRSFVLSKISASPFCFVPPHHLLPWFRYFEFAVRNIVHTTFLSCCLVSSKGFRIFNFIAHEIAHVFSRTIISAERYRSISLFVSNIRVQTKVSNRITTMYIN